MGEDPNKPKNKENERKEKPEDDSDENPSLDQQRYESKDRRDIDEKIENSEKRVNLETTESSEAKQNLEATENSKIEQKSEIKQQPETKRSSETNQFPKTRSISETNLNSDSKQHLKEFSVSPQTSIGSAGLVPIHKQDSRVQQQQQQQPIVEQPRSQSNEMPYNVPRLDSEPPRVPMIILMRRSQRISSFHPILFAMEQRGGINYQPVSVNRESTLIICPSCKARVMTMVVMEPKHPRSLITFLLITIPCCCCMSYNKPPPYSENQPGFTPASYYQPGQAQQPIYPQMPQPPAQQSTIIIQQSRPTLVALGNQPSRISCPSCHAEILTTVKHIPSGRTHCWAIVLCLFICWPCVCLPYCMDSCQNANHYCPNCQAYVGTYEN